MTSTRAQIETRTSGRANTTLLVVAAAGALLLLGLGVLMTSGEDRGPGGGVSVIAAAQGASAGTDAAAGSHREIVTPDASADSRPEPSELRAAADNSPAFDDASTAALHGGRGKPYVLSRWAPGTEAGSTSAELIVVDSADRPVAGARVEVLALSADERGMLHSVLELLTDERGRATVPPQSEPPVVRASLASSGCSGFVQLDHLVNGAGAPRLVVVPLQGIFHASGRVLLADGRPAAGATLEVGAPGYDTRPSHVPASPSADADGRFALDGHLADALIVRALAGESSSRWLDVAAQVAAGKDLALRMPGEWRIVGEALDVDGAPAAHVRLAFVPDAADLDMLDDRVWRPLLGCLEFETDDDGRFTIDVRRPGSGLLWSLSPACALPAPVRVTVPLERDEVDVLLRSEQIASRDREALSTIAGRILDDAGKPEEGAVVTADWVMPKDFPLPELRERVPSVIAEADADGRFVLRGLAASHPYDLQLAAPAEPPQSPAWRLHREQVVAGTAGLELVVAAADRVDGALQLRVVDADGDRPVADFRLAVMPLQPERHDTGGLPQDIADAAGGYRAESLVPGAHYDVLARAAGFADGVLPGVVATRDPAPLTLRLQRTGTLHVRVVDAHGAVSCAWVEALRLDAPASQRLHNVPAAARADVDGALTLPDLWPGRWSLQCERDGHTSREIAVVKPGGTTEVALTLH